jgi:hypothetical protein
MTHHQLVSKICEDGDRRDACPTCLTARTAQPLTACIRLRVCHQNLLETAERGCLLATGSRLIGVHRSLSESQPQHVRQPQNPRNFVCSLVNPGCGGWDARAPFHLGNTPLTLTSFLFLLGAPASRRQTNLSRCRATCRRDAGAPRIRSHSVWTLTERCRPNMLLSLCCTVNWFPPPKGIRGD